jgi:hypothetical protein
MEGTIFNSPCQQELLIKPGLSPGFFLLQKQDFITSNRASPVLFADKRQTLFVDMHLPIE